VERDVQGMETSQAKAAVEIKQFDPFARNLMRQINLNRVAAGEDRRCSFEEK
jgi:hypothetical protein